MSSNNDKKQEGAQAVKYWSSLEKKVIVVTGATSGIGAVAARYFAKQGARVVLTGRRAEQGAALATEIGGTFVQADAAVEDDVQRVFAEVKAKFGHVDLVFANAGIALVPDSVAAFNVENLQQQFDTNVKGPIWTFKYALPLLASDGLLIANSSSVSVLALPAMAGYAITKAALDSYVRASGEELKATGQRVYSVNPFAFPSEGAAKLGDPAQLAAQFNPSGKIGDSLWIAKLIESLALGRVNYATGSNIAIDNDNHFPVSTALDVIAKAAAAKQAKASH